jgi:hypothetical protein
LVHHTRDRHQTIVEQLRKLVLLHYSQLHTPVRPLLLKLAAAALLPALAVAALAWRLGLWRLLAGLAWLGRLGGSGGFEPHESSILHLAWTQTVAPQHETPEAWLVEGGIAQVAERLAADLAGRIHLRSPVRAIHQDAGPAVGGAAHLDIAFLALIPLHGDGRQARQRRGGVLIGEAANGIGGQHGHQIVGLALFQDGQPLRGADRCGDDDFRILSGGFGFGSCSGCTLSVYRLTSQHRHHHRQTGRTGQRKRPHSHCLYPHRLSAMGEALGAAYCAAVTIFLHRLEAFAARLLRHG